jgi:hypothetical protein
MGQEDHVLGFPRTGSLCGVVSDYGRGFPYPRRKRTRRCAAEGSTWRRSPGRAVRNGYCSLRCLTPSTTPLTPSDGPLVCSAQIEMIYHRSQDYAGICHQD